MPPEKARNFLVVRVPLVDRAVRAVAGAVDPVGEVRQELHVLVLEDRRVELERLVLDHLVVAHHQADAAVGTPANRVRPVLLDAARHRHGLQRVHHVVAVGVLQAHDRRRAVAAATTATAAASARLRRRRLGRQLRGRLDEHARAPHRRAVEPEALAVADLVAQDLLALVDPVLVLVEHDSREILLLRDHESPLAVEGDDDVAVGLVGRVDALDVEAGQSAELHAGHGLVHEACLIGCLTGRRGAHRSDRDNASEHDSRTNGSPIHVGDLHQRPAGPRDQMWFLTSPALRVKRRSRVSP